MNKELLVLLRRKRRRLNAVIILHRAAVWAMPGALGSGLFIAALRSFGMESSGYALWALLSAASAAAGAIASRSSLLDERGVARWMDVRLGENDLISAAQKCARSPLEGRFDAEILDRAATLVPKAAALRPPLQALAKRAGMAAVAAFLGAYAILLSAPIDFLGQSRSAIAKRAVSRSMDEAAAEAIEEGGAAAAQFAHSLFGDDKRMAKAAERALREGRIDDLRDLVKAAGLELDSKLSRALSEFERRKLTRERERLGQAASSIALYQESRGGGGSAAGEEGSEGGRPAPGSGKPKEGDGTPGSDNTAGADRSGAQDKPSGDSNGSKQAAEGQAKGEAGASQPGNGDDSEGRKPASSGSGGNEGRGGSDYGLGSGTTPARTALEGGKSGGEAVLPVSRDAAFFELVLPGEKTSTPIAQVVPSSRRSAESAVSRESLPLEYEDFVKSYFMALQQGEER
jgi:hypothetical protein